MNRRGFLGFALKGLGVAAFASVAGVVDAYFQYKADEKIDKESSTLFGTIYCERALRAIIDDDSEFKILGLDHKGAELATLIALSTPEMIATLQKNGITEVFPEASTAFSSLYSRAPTMDTRSFVKEYLESYPHSDQWLPASSLEERRIIMNRLSATHEALCALSKAGIEFIPYDGRDDADLGKKEVALEQIAGSQKAIDQALQNQAGFMTLAKRVCALLTGGKSSAQKMIEEDSAAAYHQLKKQNNPAYLWQQKVMRLELSHDAENFKFIQSKRKPGGKTLILAGSAHINEPGALRDIAEKAGSVTSVIYLDDREDRFSVPEYMAKVNAREKRHPDYYLSMRRGELIKPGKGETAPVREHMNKPVARRMEFRND